MSEKVQLYFAINCQKMWDNFQHFFHSHKLFNYSYNKVRVSKIHHISKPSLQCLVEIFMPQKPSTMWNIKIIYGSGDTQFEMCNC